jgi:hypothetical protein
MYVPCERKIIKISKECLFVDTNSSRLSIGLESGGVSCIGICIEFPLVRFEFNVIGTHLLYVDLYMPGSNFVQVEERSAFPKIKILVYSGMFRFGVYNYYCAL